MTKEEAIEKIEQHVFRRDHMAEDRFLILNWIEQIEVPEWRPIEDAPKDGSIVILLTSDKDIFPGFWSNGYLRWVDLHEDWLLTPTHFQFLPKPPEETELEDVPK